VNATIKIDGQAAFEAVEIEDPILDAALAAKFHAQVGGPEADALLLFQRWFGYAVARRRAGSACAWVD